jgi:phosphoketolase
VPPSIWPMRLLFEDANVKGRYPMLDAQDIELIDRYWRAANYLSVG